MSNSSENKITVKVEVIVEGGAVSTVRMSPLAHARSPYDLISSPQTAPVNTPIVSQKGGVNYIVANGTSPKSNGSYPTKVWALAYSNPNVTTAAHPTPDIAGGAVSTTPDPNTGSWSFLQTDNNAVPGACCSGSPCAAGGDNNSTLLIWWEYDTPGGVTYSCQAVTFYGYCPGSGSGSGSASMPVTALVGSRRLATTLHASFTGALAKLGSVTLTWNGVSWAGLSAGGFAVLSFSGAEAAFQLLSAGPGTSFVVAAQPNWRPRFSWSAQGMAQGVLSGHFTVTIVE